MRNISVLRPSDKASSAPQVDRIALVQGKRQNYKQLLGLSFVLTACGPGAPGEDTGSSSPTEVTTSMTSTSTASTTETIPTTGIPTSTSTGTTESPTTSTTGPTTSTTEETSSGTDTSTTGPQPDCGELTVTYQGNPEASIILTGENHLVSNQVFKATGQPYRVETLTVSNDMEGVFGDQPINAQNDLGVISIGFKDENDQPKVLLEPVTNKGETTFKDVNLFVPEDGQTELQVSVKLLANISDKVSGKKIRLGLKTEENTADTFSAVGLEDNNIDNLTQDCAVFNPNDVKAFTIRNARPVFSDAPNIGALSNGNNTLKAINIKTESSSLDQLGLNRLAYKVVLMDADNGGELDLNAFQMVRDNNVVPDARIFGVNSGNIAMGGGSISKAGDTVIVSFDQEQEISDTTVFRLQATAAGVEVNDFITTKLVADDDQVELTGLNADASTPNTGQVFVQGDATRGIFTASDVDFSQKLFPGRAIIWADGLGAPIVNNGKVTSGSGDGNHTNGNLLKLNLLKSDIIAN